MQWALTKLLSGTLERRRASQRRLMCWGETTPTVTFSPQPLSNRLAGRNRPATRCGLIPPSTILNPSSTSRRSRRWVPLLGMELATILIQPSPSTPLPFHLAPERIHMERLSSKARAGHRRVTFVTEVRRVASLGKGRYSLGAGSRVGVVKRLYTASALAISLFRFGFSRLYCISSLIFSLTAAGR